MLALPTGVPCSYPLPTVNERILGVEGGGTKTSWVLVEREGDSLRVVDEGKLPASNFRLITAEGLRAIFQQMPTGADRVTVTRLEVAASDPPAHPSPSRGS